MIASVSPDLLPLLLPAALPPEGVPLHKDPEPINTPMDTPPPSPPHSANMGNEDDDIEYIGTQVGMSYLSAIEDVVTQKALCK